MQYRQAAFLLHSYPYQNNSLITHYFCREAGRVHLLLKGVKSTRNGRQALAQVLVPVELQYTQKGELGLLNSIEPRGAPLALQGTALFAAYYLNEILLRALQPHESHPELFDHYGTCLEQLSNEQVIETQLRYFEYKLLYELGYGLDLEYETQTGNPVVASQRYQYDSDQGLYQVSVGEAAHQACYNGSTLLAFQQEQLSLPEELKQAKHLMRRLLQPILGDKPLKSREVYRQYIQNKQRN